MKSVNLVGKIIKLDEEFSPKSIIIQKKGMQRIIKYWPEDEEEIKLMEKEMYLRIYWFELK